MLDSFRNCLGFQREQADPSTSSNDCIFCNVTSERGFNVVYEVCLAKLTELEEDDSRPADTLTLRTTGRQLHRILGPLAWCKTPSALCAENPHRSVVFA